MPSEDQESESDYVSRFIEQTAAITGVVIKPFQSFQGESPVKNSLVHHASFNQNKSTNQEVNHKFKLKFSNNLEKVRSKNFEKSNSFNQNKDLDSLRNQSKSNLDKQSARNTVKT